MNKVKKLFKKRRYVCLKRISFLYFSNLNIKNLYFFILFEIFYLFTTIILCYHKMIKKIQGNDYEHKKCFKCFRATYKKA
jgi:hypothetical protein